MKRYLLFMWNEDSWSHIPSGADSYDSLEEIINVTVHGRGHYCNYFPYEEWEVLDLEKRKWITKEEVLDENN